MKPPKIYLSRNYVEFGPFEPAEISDFLQRAIVTGADHLHITGTDAWITVNDWLAAQARSAPARAKAARPAAKKAAQPARKKAANAA